MIIDPTYPDILNKNKLNEIKQKQSKGDSFNLELEVLSSSTLSVGTKIKIDQFGIIEGALRNIKDNISYFGYIENNSDNNTNNIIDKNNNEVDYLLPLKHCEKMGRFFKIQYIPKINEYIIKDMGNGLGTFIKIQDFIYIRNSSMINIGDTYLIFNFISNDDKDTIEKKEREKKNINGVGLKLKVKLFESKNNNDIKEFIFENNAESVIHIGRKNHGNNIELNDHLSSKVNCLVQYNSENGWIIKDGNEVISKNGDIKRNYSTNGTWFLAVENIKIVDKMIFKSNFNIFRCTLTKNN